MPTAEELERSFLREKQSRIRHFTPGPVQLSPRIHRAFENMHHRTELFDELLRTVKAQLNRSLGLSDDYATVIFNATGTGAMESVASSIVPFARCLFLSNGYFGNRFIDIAQRSSKDLHKYISSHYEPFNLDGVAEAIYRLNPDFVFCVHHETRTSLLNDLRKLSELVRSSGARLVVDCTSSIIAEEISVEDGIDLITYSSAKALRSMPGLGFVTGKRSVFEKLPAGSPSYYFDLRSEYMSQEEEFRLRFAQPPHLYVALKESLDMLESEGLGHRRKSIRHHTSLIRDWASSRQLKSLVQNTFCANSSSTFISPIPFKKLNERMLDMQFQIFYGESDSSSQFQLSTIGDLSRRDVDDLISALTHALQT